MNYFTKQILPSLILSLIGMSLPFLFIFLPISF